MIRAFLLSVAAGLAGPAAAQAVGTVAFLQGELSVVRFGLASKASRGTEILQGDVVRTGPASNAQLRMSDGAQVAIRPESEMKIDQYGAGAGGAKPGALVSLLRGGVRAVTGGIAASNPDGFKVNAQTATIGIRGTGFNIVLCEANCRGEGGKPAPDGLYGGVFEGRISATNKAGSAEYGTKEFFRVADENSLPQRLFAPPSFLGDRLEGQRRQSGARTSDRALPSPNVAIDAPAGGVEFGPVVQIVKPPAIPEFLSLTRFDQRPPPGLVDLRTPVASNDPRLALRASEWNLNKTGDLNSILSLGFGTALPGTLTVSYGADPTSIERIVFAGNAGQPYDIGTSVIKEGGQEQGIIAWGRWADGTALVGAFGAQPYTAAQGWHWVIGTKPDLTGFTGTVSFGMIGATTPTEARAGAQPGWAVNAGSFTANFATLSLSGTLNLELLRSDGSGAFIASYSGAINRAAADATLSGIVTRAGGSANLCVGGCTMGGNVNFYGPSAGTTPTHAGMVYYFNTGAYSVQGAAGFRAQ